MGLVQLALPVVVVLAFIVFKLNHEQKRWLFRIPIWISSTIIALVIGHSAPGVMGFYAAIACDLLLFPAMLLVKKLWLRKDQKQLQKPEVRSIPLALPRSLAVN